MHADPHPDPDGELQIDLNADLGEGVTDDAGLLEVVTSANLACGFHAGDEATMRSVCTAAAARGVVVREQVDLLTTIAEESGTRVTRADGSGRRGAFAVRARGLARSGRCRARRMCSAVRGRVRRAAMGPVRRHLASPERPSCPQDPVDDVWTTAHRCGGITEICG